MKRDSALDPQPITLRDALQIQDSFRIVEQRSGPAADRFFRELFSYDSSLKKDFALDPWRREEGLIEVLRQIVSRVSSGDSVTVDLGWIAREYPAYVLSNYRHLYFGAALVSMLEAVLGAQFKSVYGAWFKLFQHVTTQLRVQAVATEPPVLAERVEHSFAHPTAA
jgi:hypothetical protein